MSTYGTAHNERTNLHQVVRADGTPITQPRPLPPSRAPQPPAPPPTNRVPWYAPHGLTREQVATREALLGTRPWLAHRPELLPDEDAPPGEALRRRRESLRLSQRELAAAAPLSRGLIAEIEAGRRTNVRSRQCLDAVLTRLGAAPDSQTEAARV